MTLGQLVGEFGAGLKGLLFMLTMLRKPSLEHEGARPCYLGVPSPPRSLPAPLRPGRHQSEGPPLTFT